MASLNEQELGTALWAFAKWGVEPREEWLVRFVNTLQARAVQGAGRKVGAWGVGA